MADSLNNNQDGNDLERMMLHRTSLIPSLSRRDHLLLTEGHRNQDQAGSNLLYSLSKSEMLVLDKKDLVKTKSCSLVFISYLPCVFFKSVGAILKSINNVMAPN